MISIQQQAAKLAEEWGVAIKNGHYFTTAGAMAALLRQIASLGGDVEPVARVIYRRPLADISLFGASVVRGFDEFPAGSEPKYWREGEPLFTEQALDAARLAGFDAGREHAAAEAEARIVELEHALLDAEAAGYAKGKTESAELALSIGRRSQQEENQRLLAEVCRLQPLAEQRDAAIARAERAERSLVQAGYTDEGGELWKPPLGPQPSHILNRLDELLQQRDTAWFELREIRKTIYARPDESTLDEVRALIVRLIELGQPKT